MEDYRKNYKGKCLTCCNYDIYDKNSSTKRGYRCTHHHRPMAMDESCRWNYSFDGARSNEAIADAVKYRVKYGYDPRRDNSYWYIVSAICKILDLPEDHEFLINAREYRAELSSYRNGLKALHYYDIYGYIIARLLLNDYYDENLKEKTIGITCNNLLPMLEDFNNQVKYNNHDGALKKYLKLVYFLAGYYNISLDELVIPDHLEDDHPVDFDINSSVDVNNTFTRKLEVKNY